MQLLSIVYIPIEKIQPLKNNPFRPYDALKFQRMVNSVRLNGFLQPLIVYPEGADSYQILAGHERYRAGVKNGIKELPCIIWHANPTPAVYDSNNCTRSLSDEEIASQDEDKWTAEFIQTDALPKLIPKLAELYSKGEISSSVVMEFARDRSQEKQIEFLNTFSITEIVELAPDNAIIEQLETEVQKAQKEMLNLKTQISRKDTELNRLRKEKDHLTEKMEDVLEELEKARKNAQQEAMKELGKDVEEFKSKWSDVSYKLKEAETEIVNLQGKFQGIANTESAYLSELNAAKMEFKTRWNQREKDFKNQINGYEKQLHTYSRPDLIIKMFHNVSEALESLHQRISDFSFNESAIEEMEKAFSDLISAKADKLEKALRDKKEIINKMVRLPN